MKTKKTILFFSLLLVTIIVSSQSSQDILGNGLDQATQNLERNFSKIRALLYAFAAIVGVYGAVKVYGKFQNQDQDTAKAAGIYGFAFVFLAAAGYFIDAAF